MQIKNSLIALVGAAALTQSTIINERADNAPRVTTSLVIVDEYPVASVSVVYATSVVTVLSCPASVTDCPLSGSASILTSVVPVSTTVCPLTLTSVTTADITATATPSQSSGVLPPITSSSLAGAETTTGADNTTTVLSTTTRTGTSTVTIGTSSSVSTSHVVLTSTITSTSTEHVTVPPSTSYITLSSSSSQTGVENNATMITGTSSASVPLTYGGTAPASTSTGDVVGPVGATGSNGLPTSSANGTVTSPSPSASQSPYVGGAVGREVDQNLMVSFIIVLVTALVLI